LQAWSRETFSMSADAPLTTIKSYFLNTLLPKILHTPLLDHISTLQRSLDSLDCEGLAKLIEMSPSTDLTQPTMEDWVSFVDTFMSSKHQKHSSFSPSNLRYHILSYVLSATFKDCSLIIPFSPHPTDSDNNGVKVIDLDIKNVERISGWLKLDEKIVKEYAKLEIGMRKICVEGP
jgi:inositol-pentakisphosphate 2-kinase